MLQTNLIHINSVDEYLQLLEENANVMICCGRMGPMCIPVYKIMEELQSSYPHVQFRDMEFDQPVARQIIELPACKNFMSLPFVVYFKSGKMVSATSGIQSREAIIRTLNQELLP